MIPFENTSRWPRVVNCRGRKLSSAWKFASRGKSANAVFAASTRIRVVATCSTRNATYPMPVCPKTSLPMSASTVDLPVKSGATCSREARNEIPTNIVPRIRPIAVRVFWAFRHSGALNAGTPFEIASTPVIAVLPDASACSAMKRGTPASSPRPCRVRGHGLAARLEGPGREPHEPDHDQRHDAEDEHVGGSGEDLARLPDASQVPERDQADEADRHRHPEDVEARRRGDDRRDPGRDRHRDGEHVVGQERHAGHLRRQQPEVVLRHDVRAAGRGIRLDRLPVAEDQDREHADDREGERHHQREGDRPEARR